MDEPLDAARAKGIVEDANPFRQAATTRAAALTWMVWGFTLPLGLLVLGYGSGWTQSGYSPLPTSRDGFASLAGFGFLVGGAWVTGVVWHALASKPDSHLTPAISLGLMAGLAPGVAIGLIAVLFLTQVVLSGFDAVDPFGSLSGAAYLLNPNVLVIAGIWALFGSFGPWLGPNPRWTRWFGVTVVVLGMGMNALHFVGLDASFVPAGFATFVAFLAMGTVLYRRG